MGKTYVLMEKLLTPIQTLRCEDDLDKGIVVTDSLGFSTGKNGL